MRRSILCPILIVSISFLLILYYIGLLEPPQLATQVLLLHHTIFLRKLEGDHTFFSADHPAFHFLGRWTSINNGTRNDAGFPGSRVQFTINNSTTLFVALNNKSLRHPYNAITHGPQTIYYPLAKLYTQVTSPSIPVSIMIFVGPTRRYHSQNAHGTFLVCESLAQNDSYEVTVELLQSKSTPPGHLQFGGIWLSKGAKLVTEHGSTYMNVPSVSESRSKERVADDQRGTALSVIEIFAPLDTISTSKDTLPSDLYPRLLERNKLFDAVVNTIPMPSISCLTLSCHQTHRSEPNRPTISDLYFRSGPWGTPLFYYPWSWSRSQPHIESLTRNPPASALILEIGLSDFHTFISDAPSPLSQKDLDVFTNDFVASYTKFVLTIRRTAWQQRRVDQTSQNQDQSYSYNSAPSTLPIFLMVPMIPPTSELLLLLINILHNAVQRVVTTLQEIEGDKCTFIIDTSGWLDESDFIRINTSSSSPSNSPFPSSLSLSSFGNQPTPNPQPANLTTTLATMKLKKSSHKKISEYLSLHLCPDLPHRRSDGIVKCPFFNNNPRYRGSIYTPEQTEIVRILEERKIEKVKRMIGFVP